jgi:hypothetical protein
MRPFPVRIRLRERATQLDLVGIALAALLFTAAALTPQPAQSLFVGVAASFVFAGVLRLLLSIQRSILLRKQIRFFGYELTSERTILVYPDFVLSMEAQETLHLQNQQLLFQRPHSPYPANREHRVDLHRAVAGNDVQALLYVAELFESSPDNPNIMLVDTTVVENCDRSFISFGLSSNDCTHLYLDESERPLFELVPDGGGSEYIRLRDGCKFVSDDHRQYGLIVRYRPVAPRARGRRWFLVAGLGPHGTTGAAWYLAHNWRDLSERVPSSVDFAAVISCSTATDRTSYLTHLLKDQPVVPPVIESRQRSWI